MDASIKERMNARIRSVMKEKAGPSFEERVAVSAARFSKQTKATEDNQARLIAAAVARAREKPCESAVRPKHHVPPSIEEHGKEHAQTRRENEKRYAEEAAARKHRMDSREPLFKLSEVNAAFEMQDKRMKENKRRMQEDEEKRWDHLRELQERVLDRPLLIEDPSGGAGDGPKEHNEEEQAEKDPNWKAKFQHKMHKRITQTIKDRSGPSFEERVAVRATKFRKEAKATVDSQTQVIEAAIARAKARPCESPFRSQDLTPPTVEDWGKEHKQTRLDNEARFAIEDAERKNRMNTREPLFRVSEVQAAFEMQAQRSKENKRRLQKDEKERWEFLQTMQERVIDRPMLMEKYERDRHTKSNPDIRLIPDHSKPVPLQHTVNKCVSQPWFTESAWGKEVATLRARMDARKKLHEISYPPKVFAEKPCRPKMKTPIDERLASVMNQAWFKSSQWASDVKGIQERQDNRTKLCDMKYPAKER